MSRRQFSRFSGRRAARYLAGNPLWPLEELHNVRNPPFIADPEFAPFDIDTLGSQVRRLAASPNDPGQFRWSKHLCLHGIPIPHLVAGLPWRFAQETRGPVIPETEFVPLDLSRIKLRG